MSSSNIYLTRKINVSELNLNKENEYKKDSEINKQIIKTKINNIFNFPEISNIKISQIDLEKISSSPYTYIPKEIILPNPIESIDNKFKYFCIKEIPLEILMKKYYKRKINIILDIDQTLIFSKDEILFDPKIKNELTKDSNPIIVPNESQKNNPFRLIFDYRPKLKEFLIGLSKFCNFYVCTLAKENYAKMITYRIKKDIGIEIPDENIVATVNIKGFELFNGIETKNTIIFDDNANVWIKELKHLIVSKKFVSFLEKDYKFDFVVEDYKIINYNSRPDFLFTNETKSNNKFQLDYVLNFIEMAYKFSIIFQNDIVNSIGYMRKRIFNKVKLNIQYYSQNENYILINGIVKFLGGIMGTDINQSTHFLLSEQNNLKKERLNLNNEVYFVNEQWVFDSYLFLQKMDENEREYKMKIN